jgi:hypothetical protein
MRYKWKFTEHGPEGTPLLTLHNQVTGDSIPIGNVDDLLKLQEQLTATIRKLEADGKLIIGERTTASPWLDLGTARKLAHELGYGQVPPTSIRSACERGNIPSARKVSRSGRAQTKEGGQWEFPRQEYIDWLVQRASTDRRGRHLT